MRTSLIARRGLLALAGILIVVSGSAVGLLLAVQAGHFRDGFLHLIAERIGRPIDVHGTLSAHLFSLTPRLEARQVEIGNPPWMPPGKTADIGDLVLVLQLPWIGHRFGVASLSLQSARLYLVRDASGRANWQWAEHGRPARRLHIVRSLAVPDAEVTLDDARRHLTFRGTASMRGLGTEPLTLSASGQLNGHPVNFEIHGDALGSASHEEPYGFTFTERSSGTLLEGRGALPRPFDFSAVEASYQAQGADLRDLYYLTGTGLPNTGPYRLSGKFRRDALRFDFFDLAIASGASDASGSISVDSAGERPKLDVRLESRLLRAADMGARAAGRAPPRTGPRLLFSEASLRPESLRVSDADIAFRAESVQIGHALLENLSAQATLRRGVLDLRALSASLLGGKLGAHGRMDATREQPAVSIDISISGLELDRIHHGPGAAAPIEGALRAQVQASGTGSSAHQFAATANGSITLVVPHGELRDSLAEITGMDLRGLGLLLSGDKRATELRCAAGRFEIHDGVVTTQRFVADTDSVLITAEGRLRLDDESLDLRLRGQPKSVRLFRFRAPVTLKGTLEQPAFGIEPRHLEVIDTDKAADQDCAALIASTEAAIPARP